MTLEAWLDINGLGLRLELVNGEGGIDGWTAEITRCHAPGDVYVYRRQVGHGPTFSSAVQSLCETLVRQRDTIGCISQRFELREAVPCVFELPDWCDP